MKRGVITLTTALLVTPSLAADLNKEILTCSALTDSIKRLECFDNLAAREQANADQQATKELTDSGSTPDNWDLSISQSKIDDTTTVLLRTRAQEPVAGRFNRIATPTLVLRCLENTTVAYINFDGLHMTDIQNYGQVTFRVDKQKAFSLRTRNSTDNKALGLWSGNSAIPFIKRLYGGNTLLVQATPFNDSPVTFSLNIAGLESAIQPLRTACKW